MALIVLFGWMPDTFMHDAAGVVGLGLYVFSPLYFIVKTGSSFLNNSRFNDSINMINIFPKVKNFLKDAFSFKFITVFKSSFTILILIWLTYISFNKITTDNISNLLTINYLEQTHCPKTMTKDGIIKYENSEILVYLKPIPGFYAAEHSPLICWQGSGYRTILKREPNFNLVNITSVDTAALYKNIKHILINISSKAQVQKYTFNQAKMGSPFKIVAYAADYNALSTAVNKAYERVDALNTIFSDYDEKSEISILSKTYKKNKWIGISSELWEILKISRDAALQSNGAYDVTVGNIVKEWRKARKAKRLPNVEVLKAALSKTGFQHLEIHKKKPKIRFDTEGVLLDFGGIVKGYAAQEAVRILSEAGFPSCFADAGGDLAFGNFPPNHERWSIGVTLPNEENILFERLLSFENLAIATSGDMYNLLKWIVCGIRISSIPKRAWASLTNAM